MNVFLLLLVCVCVSFPSLKYVTVYMAPMTLVLNTVFVTADLATILNTVFVFVTVEMASVLSTVFVFVTVDMAPC